MSFNICFKLLKKKKKHTSATVELVRSVATVVSSITFLLLQNTIIVLTDKLASITPCTEPGKNSMRTAPSMLMSIRLSVLTACVCVCVCGCVCVCAHLSEYVCVHASVRVYAHHSRVHQYYLHSHRPRHTARTWAGTACCCRSDAE